MRDVFPVLSTFKHSFSTQGKRPFMLWKYVLPAPPPLAVLRLSPVQETLLSSVLAATLSILQGILQIPSLWGASLTMPVPSTDLSLLSVPLLHLRSHSAVL